MKDLLDLSDCTTQNTDKLDYEPSPGPSVSTASQPHPEIVYSETNPKEESIPDSSTTIGDHVKGLQSKNTRTTQVLSYMYNRRNNVRNSSDEFDIGHCLIKVKVTA